MQSKLRILGLFEWMDFPQATFEVIGLLTKRDPSRRTWPYIICIDENDKPFFTTSIFAPFFSDAYATYQPIVESIDEYYARDLQLTREMVRGVTVYLKDFSNMTYVCDIADLAATYFPELRVINMLVLDESCKASVYLLFRPKSPLTPTTTVPTDRTIQKHSFSTEGAGATEIWAMGWGKWTNWLLVIGRTSIRGTAMAVRVPFSDRSSLLRRRSCYVWTRERGLESQCFFTRRCAVVVTLESASGNTILDPHRRLCPFTSNRSL